MKRNFKLITALSVVCLTTAFYVAARKRKINNL
jgi:hypothetical protein